jgi:formylmethanofuran dehydrogenase subunit C
VTLTLTLREPLAAPLETIGLRPVELAGRSRASIERQQLRYGNRLVAVGELFDVSGDGEEDVRIEGDLRRATHLGAGMTGGRLVIAVTGAAASGAAGTEVGARMAGGELLVEGDVGDWAGAEMRGGRLVVRGSAGRRLGGAHPGARAGMRGGEIVVHGDAGEEAGAGLRRGLIAVAGALGAAAGVRALAGTLVALGGVGPRPGAGMRRATIVAMAPVTPLPTYARACAYRPAFLRVVLGHLRALGLPVSDEQLAARYTRWCGDGLELNRGEILVLEP